MTIPFRSLTSHFHARAHRDPVRDWFVLLTLSFLALVSITVWNIWAFETVAQGGAISGSVSDTTSPFNRSSLDAIHEVFEARATEEAKYVTGVYRYADPSQ